MKRIDYRPPVSFLPIPPQRLGRAVPWGCFAVYLDRSSASAKTLVGATCDCRIATFARHPLIARAYSASLRKRRLLSSIHHCSDTH